MYVNSIFLLGFTVNVAKVLQTSCAFDIILTITLVLQTKQLSKWASHLVFVSTFVMEGSIMIGSNEFVLEWFVFIQILK